MQADIALLVEPVLRIHIIVLKNKSKKQVFYRILIT